MTGDGRFVDRYAVIGNPVAHSKSPQIHAAFAQATGQAMCYERLLAPVDAFAAAVREFVERGGRGLSVTIPFKLEAYALARDRSERAATALACNALAWCGDHWYGDNTDGAGLVLDLKHNLCETIAGREVLVLGAGGAARGIVDPLLAEAPRRLTIANRTHSRAGLLAASFKGRGAIAAEPLSALAGRRFDIVINTTSVGLDASAPSDAWPRGVFGPDALAYDLNYADATTPFLRWAEREGARRCADGLGMLVEQAAESFLLWRGVRPETAPVFRLLRTDRPEAR